MPPSKILAIQMRKARRFISREKQTFLVRFSLAFPRFPRISKNRLNTSIGDYRDSVLTWFQRKQFPNNSQKHF